MDIKLKQGRPPRESERGPYAVVDERYEDTTLKEFGLNQILVTAAHFAHFLDPITVDSRYSGFLAANFHLNSRFFQTTKIEFMK